MLSNSLFGAHQTQDRIRAYQVHILSYSYLTFLSYPLLSYPIHKTDPKQISINFFWSQNINLEKESLQACFKRGPKQMSTNKWTFWVAMNGLNFTKQKEGRPRFFFNGLDLFNIRLCDDGLARLLGRAGPDQTLYAIALIYSSYFRRS